MARAKTKVDLLDDYNKYYFELLNLIDTFNDKEKQLEFLFDDRDRNINDVIIHLFEWQNMMIRWYEEGCLKGLSPDVPKAGYTWLTIAQMNLEIQKRYQHLGLAESLAQLELNHYRLVQTINQLTDEQLYQKGYYKWTKTTTLGQYLVSAGPSHYQWAIKKIKKQAKLLAGVSK